MLFWTGFILPSHHLNKPCPKQHLTPWIRSKHQVLPPSFRDSILVPYPGDQLLQGAGTLVVAISPAKLHDSEHDMSQGEPECSVDKPDYWKPQPWRRYCAYIEYGRNLFEEVSESSSLVTLRML